MEKDSPDLELDGAFPGFHIGPSAQRNDHGEVDLVSFIFGAEDFARRAEI